MSQNPKTKTEEAALPPVAVKRPTCGIVMPISAMDNCSSEHWLEVMKLIKESAEIAGFDCQLVSDSEESGIIQKRIVTNIYHSDIIVADVSGKNPNVMFELGMRLAFDKPAIVIKDDKTNYSFDTGIIEHIPYPRDLHYYNIIAFKDQLSKKIKATYTKSSTDPEYTTFLKHFGEFTVAKIEKTELPSQDYMVKSIEALSEQVSALQRSLSARKNSDLATDVQSDFSRLNDSELRRVIRDHIEQYRLKLDMSEEAVSLLDPEKLAAELENSRELRRLVGTPTRMRKLVESVMKEITLLL